MKLDKIREGAWINVENTNREDLKVISRLTDLNLSDLEDILDPYEMPRIERHGQTIIIFLRTPCKKSSQNEALYTQSLTIIITDKYFITFSIDRNRIVRNVLKKKLDFSTTQRSKLLIYILLRIGKRFTREIKNVRNNVLSQKKNIRVIENSDIIRLIESEDILNHYTSALIPMRNVLETISKGGFVKLYEHDTDLFEDMIISMKQSSDICDVNIKTIQSLRVSYQIIFTNRLNKVIKFLTSFTIIMTIPTIIASVYGMNVRLPLSNNPLAFVYILIISFVVSLLFLILFAKKRWM
ncbi:magnesium transporter CorA family protein [bacterium]|nr:magnesium transporter CorA family protein [bacterium]